MTFLAPVAALIMTGCTSYHSNITNQPLADKRSTQMILLLPPVSPEPNLLMYAGELGSDFNIELARVITKGEVVYGCDVRSLGTALTWNNLILNGEFNADEISSMAKHVGCQSVLAVELRDVQQYPPQRAVVYLYWYDADTAKLIGRVYNDVDMNDWKTRRIYGNYIDYGPLKMLEEKLFYSEDQLQTASLSPQRFRQFVAAYSVNLLFGQMEYGWFYRFWNAIT